MIASDKKKIGALVGSVIVGSAIIVGLLKFNSRPDEIVDQGVSGRSNQPSASIVKTEVLPTEASEQERVAEHSKEYNSERLTEPQIEESREQSRQELVARGESSKKQPESSAKNEESKKPAESGKPSESTKPAESTKPSESTRPEQSSKPEESENQAQENKPPELNTKIAANLDKLTPYQGQALGNTKIFFYQHPTQSVGFDLRRSPKMAAYLYVHPTKEGFLIFPRQMMSLLSLNEADLDEWLKTEKIPGAVLVKKVDAEARKKMEADHNTPVSFVDAEENYSYAVSMPKAAGKEYQNIYSLLDKPFNVAYVTSNLSTGGMIGNPPDKPKNVTWEDQLKSWDEFKIKMKDNPAIGEMDYNLPLLAQSEGYIVDGNDIRQNIPTEDPVYSFGRVDLDGDGTPEFIMHAKTSGSKKGRADGYWTIMTPSPTGLKMANVFAHGNGDLLKKDKNLIIPSLYSNKDEKILTIAEAQPGYPVDNKDKPSIKLKKVKGESGEKLAKDYPDSYLILLGDEIYLMDLKEYDKFVDYALEKIKGAESLNLVGELEDENTGKKNPDGVIKEEVKDPMLYLQELYPDLPFSTEKLNKLAKTKDFKNIKEPLTVGHFDRVE